MRSSVFKADGTSTTYYEGVKSVAVNKFTYYGLGTSFVVSDCYISIGI